MAEFLQKLQELKGLPPGLHWFCNTCDASNSPDPDVQKVNSEPSIANNSRLRQEQACECLTLFSYEEQDAFKVQEELAARIRAQLSKCDLCVVGYYKSRRHFIEQLQRDYDEDEVSQLVQKFNAHDIARIKLGLESATRTLKKAGPAARHKDILDLASQLSLFEALSCEAFLTNENLLKEHFQEPFKLVQTNRRLKITQYVPAVTLFLFDDDQDRRAWATYIWSRYKSIPTDDDFDFAIKNPLFKNMQRCFETIPQPTWIQRLWYGVGVIVDNVDNNLITHSLRALEIDVFRLALDHLRYDSEGLRYLIQTIQKLLEKAPRDFWNAMGAISPTTFIEQIFNNPQYDRFIAIVQETESLDSAPIWDMLEWIKPFMASLETVHQARACRSLAFQLLDRLQADRFPIAARLECKRVGFATLAWTLNNCSKENMTLTHTGRITVAETLDIASDYIRDIIKISASPADDEGQKACAANCLKIVKIALALECKSLRIDQETFRQNQDFPESHASYSSAIWDAVVQHLDRGNIIVARAALVGINDLTGLEKVKLQADEKYAKEKSSFNVTLGRLTHLVCQIIERINDFSPSDLDALFRHSDTATALVASLFSPDASLYEAGVNLIKSISSESARREAIGHLLKTFLETTLNAFSWTIGRIAKNRTYASCPRMLKTSTDIIDILCDSQDGLLRAHTLSSMAGIKALENFWEHQWEGLQVIYEMTEDWGRAKVADANSLKEFCRDTMQFSERFFDQYSVFANAIDSANGIKRQDGLAKIPATEAGLKLLGQPAKVMEAMSKWLRLRDPFLVEISVKLMKKVLSRLTERGLKIAEKPRESLVYVLNSRTNLQPQEKAELARALEDNLGRSIAVTELDNEESDLTSDRSRERSTLSKKKTKLSTIDLNVWRAKSKASGQVIEVSDDEFDDSDVLDQDLLSVSRSAELMKGMEIAVASRKEFKQIKPSDARDRKSATQPAHNLKASKVAKASIQSDADRQSFREKREKEREAKKKRDAETLALVKKKAGIGSALGEASGLGNLGVKGKDHAPKVQSMMVSSGSESETEDEIDLELFGHGPRAPKIPDDSRFYKPNMASKTHIRGPIKKTRQVRSAKDIRARLAPELGNLHKTILGWDFFHNGDFPPGSARDDYSLVTSTFRTAFDYQNTFEPLLVLEAWQGFLKSKEEGNFRPYEVKVANRMTVDASIEISTSMPPLEAKELGIGEADVVLLSKSSAPSNEAHQPHCLARVHKINRKKLNTEIAYRVNVGNDLVAAMVPNATLHAVKITSLTPLEREYGALLGLQYFDLCDEVIKAKPSPLLDYSEKQLAPLVTNYNINVAQAKAIRSAVDNDAFTLIQGPPGSGKTKTIVAIVGALLTGSFGDKGVPIVRPEITRSIAPRTTSDSAAKKLLVCAPSNAAVDELVMRFKEGVKTTEGNTQRLSIVRLGRSEAINSNVQDVTLEELISAKLNLVNNRKAGADKEAHSLMMAHKATCDQFNTLRTVTDELKANGKTTSEQDREFESLKRKKQQLSNQIDAARDNGDVVARDAELKRRHVQQEILDGAHVICATLSGSGHEMFQNLNIEFETVIIDEAAQSIELSALIPLKYGCSKCILVGDPKQLPPTVLSREAARFQYEQSLFVRMQSNHPNDVHLLDTQYRMHPEISAFPSNAFYDGRLLNGAGMAKLRTRPWHQSKFLGAYRFFDVQGQHQSAPRGHSLINLAEIDIALKLFDRLVTDCRGYDFDGKVGIITPYKSQLRELKSRFKSKYGEDVLSTVEFNTTDAFQGRESEIIIFSCVRASVNKGIGFLSDIRRMNVGITRAKCSLWVLGNSHSLGQGEFWSRLIQDAKSRDRYTTGDLSGIFNKPLLSLDPKLLASSSSRSVVASPIIATPVDPDVDMPDAPVSNPSNTISYRPKSNVAESSTGNVRESDSKTAFYSPAGGSNGLNPNGNCQKCGSFSHWTSHCDSLDPVPEQCFRCKGNGHRKNSCTAERCLACGEFGHLQKSCTNLLSLSNKERDRVSRQEGEHKSYLRHASEEQRKRQLGDHAKSMPVVRSTSTSPPPRKASVIVGGQSHKTGEKRRREGSPPSNAPKGPKMARVNENTDPSKGGSNGSIKIDKNKSDINANGASKSSLDPRPAKRPENGGSTIIKAGQGPRADATPRPPPPPTVARPPPPKKRKKEVDPFIKPKRR